MPVRRIAALLALFLLSSCLEPPNVPPPQQFSFSQYRPIQLDIATISVVQEYRSPQQKPNVEHLFPTSPAQAMDIWTHDRLKAVGGSRRLEVQIKDASVIETDLPRKQGITGAFTNDQAKRFDARLEVELRIYGDRAMSDASVHITATRSDTLDENASAAKRDALFNRMTTMLMDEVNAELEKNIYQYFGNYITYSE